MFAAVTMTDVGYGTVMFKRVLGRTVAMCAGQLKSEIGTLPGCPLLGIMHSIHLHEPYRERFGKGDWKVGQIVL